MVRRNMGIALLALIALVALATPALAGGWAVVTLDTVPTAIRAEQSLSLGFMVRQHGVTPVDVHVWDGSMPVLTATNASTGETLRIHARKEGVEGHYVVDVTFPNAGAWNLEIVPEPFGGTKLGTFTVQPAASSTAASVSAWATQPALLRLVGGGLVFAALSLTLMRRRSKDLFRAPAVSAR